MSLRKVSKKRKSTFEVQKFWYKGCEFWFEVDQTADELTIKMTSYSDNRHKNVRTFLVCNLISIPDEK